MLNKLKNKISNKHDLLITVDRINFVYKRVGAKDD